MNIYEKGQRQEFIARATEIYEKLKGDLESAHKDEIVAIHPESGEFFLGKTLNEADGKAYEQYPDVWLYFVRIGTPEAALPLKTW
jgi:hypothetical protein